MPFGLLIIGALYSCGNQNKLNEKNNTESEVKLKKSGLDKSAMNAIGSRRNVDMSQFAKTELYVPYANTDNPTVEMKNKVEKLTGRVSELITFESAGHGDTKIKSTENVINNLYFMDELLKT